MSASENDLVVGPVVPALGVTVISLDFFFEDETQLQVYQGDNPSPLVLNTDYTVTGAGTATGQITLAVAADGVDAYSVYFVPEIERSSDLPLRGDFQTAPVNAELDRITRALQYLRTQISRTFRVSETSPVVASLFSQNVGARASRSVIFNPTGDGLAIGPTSDEIANAQQYAEDAAAQVLLAANQVALATTQANNAAASATAADGFADDAAGSAAAAAASAAAAAEVIAFTGAIIMWSGLIANIPLGWQLCDGSNGTPDLRGRFVIGAGDAYNVADTGGQESITDVPAHTHGAGSLSASSGGSHTHGVTDPGHSHNLELSVAQSGSGSANGNSLIAAKNVTRSSTFAWQDVPSTLVDGAARAKSGSTGISVDSGGAHTHGVAGTTGSTGSASVDIRPPYYALAFIMKL